jgi:ubiquinone/menaquinone biosynthesis C-methylase UbiE
MNDLQKFNLGLVEQGKTADEINREFYSKFSYPWPPRYFPSFDNAGMTKMLNQDIGCYSKPRLPDNARIWVAGCGTNQAILTALKFPQAEVIGSDISTGSLNICRRNMKSIGIKNLQLIEKSINEVNYDNEFDFIICTGVVHHNSDPDFTFGKLSKGLKKNGVMEFMVYNYYHRILNVAMQKAVRALTKFSFNLDDEYNVSKKLIESFPYKNLLRDFISQYRNVPTAEMADAIFQPIEYSYTVETLHQLIDKHNIQYLQPCVNQFDAMKGNYSWNINFEDQSLAELYKNLSDCDRWQITNLLKIHDSSALWFYLQRKDADELRRTEQEVCDDFLNTRFRKYKSEIRHYMIDENGDYTLSPARIPHPSPPKPSDEMSRMVFDAVNDTFTVGEILDRLSIPRSFQNVNRIRINTTTSLYPYLEALS